MKNGEQARENPPGGFLARLCISQRQELIAGNLGPQCF